MIPLWFKLAYTVFVVVIVAIWLRHYGWRNLLWFSDIALIGAVPAFWLEDARIASVLAVAVLLPEMLWNVDLAGRLLLGRRISGLTDYMFEQDRPLVLRRLSLFHVPLPLVLLWLLAAYGYAERIALPGAILLAAVVLPLEPRRKRTGEEHQLELGPRTVPEPSARRCVCRAAVPRIRDPRLRTDPRDPPQHLSMIAGLRSPVPVSAKIPPASRTGHGPRPTCLPGQGGERQAARCGRSATKRVQR